MDMIWLQLKEKIENGDNFIKSLFAKLFYRIMKIFMPMEQGVQDFRIMTREVVDTIISLKEYNRFSKGIFTWIGFNTKYITIDNIKRTKGNTKWGFKNLFKYAIEGIVSFTTAPLRLSTITGILVSTISIISALIIVTQTILLGKDVPGYASTITAILFMGGIQLLSIGILSEYMSKIYLEIKNRPKYIIKQEKEEENERNI